MGSLRSLVRNPVFRRRLGVLWTMFFTASIAAYANDLNSSSLSGNLFVNQLLFGLLIAASKIVGLEICILTEVPSKLFWSAQSSPNY